MDFLPWTCMHRRKPTTGDFWSLWLLSLLWSMGAAFCGRDTWRGEPDLVLARVNLATARFLTIP